MNGFIRYHQDTRGSLGPLLLSMTAFLLIAAQVSGAPVTCNACHSGQAEDFSRSAHSSLKCQECHGGSDAFDLSPADVTRFSPPSSGARPEFDHGPTFQGKAVRSTVPRLCGTCHANVERMNPYGLRTDQLTRYETSVHGKALRDQGDERVAVCTDCHGVHDIRSARDPNSLTHPLNVPSTCGKCHEDTELMASYGLRTEVVDEYRQSVHGRLLLEQKDTGAPTCATCHGNHSATPPGFPTVVAVCSQCHVEVAKYFNRTSHASLEEHKGCVQCHGGGEGRHFHLIEKITKRPGLMVQRYKRLLETHPNPSREQVAQAINPSARKIITRALPTCTECHDDPEEDESLPKLFGLLDEISEADRHYVQTALRIDEVGKGVLLVESQRFKFEDAKTDLIGLAPLQHTLDHTLVAEKAAALNKVCDEVNAELDELETGLRWRYRALVPIWLFAILFACLLYAKYKQLHAVWVKPLPEEVSG